MSSVTGRVSEASRRGAVPLLDSTYSEDALWCYLHAGRPPLVMKVHFDDNARTSGRLRIAGNWHGRVSSTSWSGGSWWVDMIEGGMPRRMIMELRYCTANPRSSVQG